MTNYVLANSPGFAALKIVAGEGGRGRWWGYNILYICMYTMLYRRGHTNKAH